MALHDPLLVCRQILLADPAVAAIVGTRVYATPVLPKDHTYPLIRLTHIGSSDYSPVGFRHAATATVQLDAWALTMPELYDLKEQALSALHDTPPAGSGASRIAVTSEVMEIDESLQPALYRCRADIAVRVGVVPVP